MTNWLNPYELFMRAKNWLYDSERLPMQRLERPVISVGNISVGGTGKTPFVMMLGDMLKQRGIRFDVLSRGYGRKTSGVMVVDPDGSSEQYGDEPLLIARKLGVPVILGESRYAAGKLAENRFDSQYHLIDDGFQHRTLARDFDIVLLGERDLTGSVLPFGRLREPVSGIRRADVVVLTQSTESEPQRMESPVWRVRRTIGFENVRAGKALAFCGIAKPANFYSALRAAGVELAAETSFPDHHRYSKGDVERLKQRAGQEGTSLFVTTEKDAVNLGELRGQLAPLEIVPLRVELEDASVVDQMLQTIAERRARRS